MKMRSRSHSAETRVSRTLGGAWLLMSLVCMLVAATAAAVLAAPVQRSLLPSEPGSLQVQSLEALTRPTSISSYGGWAAWSRYDPTHRGYQLMARNANGEVSATGIAESPSRSK